MTEHNMPPGPDDAGLKTRVLRELIRTPAFRELVKLNLAESEPERARELVRTILWEDPNLSLSAAAVSPDKINGLIVALHELGMQLSNLTPELVDAFFAELGERFDRESLRQTSQVWAPHILRLMPDFLRAKMNAAQALAHVLDDLPAEQRIALRKSVASGIDGAAIAGAMNAWANSVKRLRAENPDLAADLSPAMKTMVAELDFGHLREAITIIVEYDAELFLAFLAPVMYDPMVLANVAVTIPPLINQAVKVAGSALSMVELPSEILASSVFGLIEDLDETAMADLANVVTQMLTNLGEGDKILGGDEPHFRGVLADKLDSFLDRLDYAAVLGATRALGTDLETVTGVFAEVPRRDTEFLLTLISAGASFGGSITRSITTVLENGADLPDEVLRAVGERLHEELRPREMATLVSAAARFYDRFRTVNPDINLLGDFLAAIDGRQIRSAAGKAAACFERAATSDKNIQAALEPENVGRQINAALIAFNSRFDRKEKRPPYFSRLLAEIDAKELRRTLGFVTGGLSTALAENREQGCAIFSSMLSAGWSLVRTRAGAVKQRLVGSPQTAGRS